MEHSLPLLVISFCNTEFTGKPLKQKPLLNALTPVTAQWQSFGIQLGVDHSKLKEFEDFTRNVKYYLSETLQIWLKQNDPPPTVQDLLDALTSPVLSNNTLAKKLEKKYKGNRMLTQHAWFVLICRKMYGFSFNTRDSDW